MRPHGTAPLLFRKNVANPMAMILAGRVMIQVQGGEAAPAGGAVRRRSSREFVDGMRTGRDFARLNGHELVYR